MLDRLTSRKHHDTTSYLDNVLLVFVSIVKAFSGPDLPSVNLWSVVMFLMAHVTARWCNELPLFGQSFGTLKNSYWLYIYII